MRFLPIILALLVTACAIATGAYSTATVGVTSDLKREVAASAPIIEEVFVEKK
jgi:hypothetical protein